MLNDTDIGGYDQHRSAQYKLSDHVETVISQPLPIFLVGLDLQLYKVLSFLDFDPALKSVLTRCHLDSHWIAACLNGLVTDNNYGSTQFGGLSTDLLHFFTLKTH
jgi:hypothetical protein